MGQHSPEVIQWAGAQRHSMGWGRIHPVSHIDQSLIMLLATLPTADSWVGAMQPRDDVVL
jgi:hypothetical protein